MTRKPKTFLKTQMHFNLDELNMNLNEFCFADSAESHDTLVLHFLFHFISIINILFAQSLQWNGQVERTFFMGVTLEPTGLSK